MIKLFPTAEDFPKFKESWKKDLVAGVTVGIVALPLALAFGITTGTGAASGLITAVIAGFLAAFFGGSNFQVSGPTGAMTVVLVPIVSKYGITVLPLIGLFAGIIVLIAGILQLGAIIKRVPWSVMEGFTLGIALVIALQQLPGALAVKSVSGHGTVGTAINTFRHALSIGLNWQALLVVAITLTIKFGYPKLAEYWNFRIHVPASFVAIVIANLLLQLTNFTLPTVGDLPKNLFKWANLDNNIAISNLVIPILEIALLAAIESLLSARVADGMVQHQDFFHPYNPNRELFGQGLASIFSSVFGGLPATGAIARTGVNVRSGARTRAAATIHALFLLVAVFILNPIISQISTASLAAILIGTSYRIARPSAIKEALATTKLDASILLITALIVLTIDLIWGILIGTVLYFILNKLIMRAKSKSNQ